MKQKKSKYIVIPAYYEGTSFQELAEGLRSCIKKYKLPVYVIGLKKPLPNKLQSGELDDQAFVTAQKKIIAEIIRTVQSSSEILFLDFFFPGIDLLLYHFQQKQIRIKTGALLHGGSFLKGDLQQQFSWLKQFELGYFEAFDIIYAPSKFLKEKCPADYQGKIYVTPWGMDSFKPAKKKLKKKLDVIFPHRISGDKGIEDLIAIAHSLPLVNFYITVPQPSIKHISHSFKKELKSCPNIYIFFNENKKKHHVRLASAKLVLSCAKQENFGYAIHKSIESGCIPVLPSGVCYEEFFDSAYIYNTIEQAIDLIKHNLSNSKNIAAGKIYKTEIKLTFLNLLKHFYEK